jgi:hypothetical protein
MVWCSVALASLLAAGSLVAQVPGAENASDQFSNIKRVYVERFGGAEGADQIRDMVIAALQRTNLFLLTENPERADALLRGSAEDMIYTESFQSNEGITARLMPAGSTNLRSGTRLIPGVSVGDHDNVHIQERKHEASASVRLVNRDGDVIWSTIQESQGAKFHGAAADVAERIGRQLTADITRARVRRGASPEEPGSGQ